MGYIPQLGLTITRDTDTLAMLPTLAYVDTDEDELDAIREEISAAFAKKRAYPIAASESPAHTIVIWVTRQGFQIRLRAVWTEEIRAQHRAAMLAAAAPVEDDLDDPGIAPEASEEADEQEQVRQQVRKVQPDPVRIVMIDFCDPAGRGGAIPPFTRTALLDDELARIFGGSRKQTGFGPAGEGVAAGTGLQVGRRTDLPTSEAIRHGDDVLDVSDLIALLPPGSVIQRALHKIDPSEYAQDLD